MPPFDHPKPPPGYVDPKKPEEKLVLSRHGLWLADGHEITHEATRKAFARSLKHDNGGWFIHIGHETKYVEVEDTAFFVVRIDEVPGGGWELTLSDESREKLAPETLTYRPDRLTCRLRERPSLFIDGSIPIEAKFLTAPYFDLLKNLEQDERGYYLQMGGQRIGLGGPLGW